MRIIICSLLAAFIGGTSLGLLASYPIEENSIYVCFWALLGSLVSCLLGAWAMVDWAVKRERIHVDRLVDAVVAGVLDGPGMEAVKDR